MADAFCVYVVDDDESVRKALSRLLNASGYQVKAYAQAEQFLAELGPDAAGCLLLDMTMPKLSGLQTQIRMREMGRDLPVIAVSALDDNQVRERARELGASFFLRKPVDDQALMDAIAWVSAGDACTPRAVR
jgi:FixJ family two-component response regulator